MGFKFQSDSRERCRVNGELEYPDLRADKRVGWLACLTPEAAHIVVRDDSDTNWSMILKGKEDRRRLSGTLARLDAIPSEGPRISASRHPEITGLRDDRAP